MYETLDDISALFGEGSESVNLEFKSGRTFDNLSSDVRREFVKDVTAFGNAGGGTILVGVAEARGGSLNTAVGFDPVTNDRVSVDQLMGIVTSNTDPPFGALRIQVLHHEQGRIFVVDIDQADTAHQNRLDQRYYQRAGAISAPMFDFAIRDVMHRRTKPRITVQLYVRVIAQGAERHQYQVAPRLTNDGHRNARYWSLYLDLPSSVCEANLNIGRQVVREHPRYRDGGAEYSRYEFQSTLSPLNPLPPPLLPGQHLDLTEQNEYPAMNLNVDQAAYRELLRAAQPPLRWTLFADECPRQVGEVNFAGWCRF